MQRERGVQLAFSVEQDLKNVRRGGPLERGDAVTQVESCREAQRVHLDAFLDESLQGLIDRPAPRADDP